MKYHNGSIPPTEPLLDWRPIAKFLGLHERAFWRHVHEDKIPFYKLNKRVLRFRLSEVESWLSRRKIISVK